MIANDEEFFAHKRPAAGRPATSGRGPPLRINKTTEVIASHPIRTIAAVLVDSTGDRMPESVPVISAEPRNHLRGYMSEAVPLSVPKQVVPPVGRVT